MAEKSERTVQVLDTGPIVAKPAGTHRLKLLGVVLVLLGVGAWCAWDGFVNWPNLNRQFRERGQKEPHSGWDLWLNQGLAILLPIGAMALLARIVIKSRGRYRIEGDLLSVPGHPTIALGQLVSISIDKRRWNKKGIAEIDYELPGGRKGHFILDDFYFEREPTDKILQRIEQLVKPDSAAPVAAASTEQPVNPRPAGTSPAATAVQKPAATKPAVAPGQKPAAPVQKPVPAAPAQKSAPAAPRSAPTTSPQKPAAPPAKPSAPQQKPGS